MPNISRKPPPRFYSPSHSPSPSLYAPIQSPPAPSYDYHANPRTLNPFSDAREVGGYAQLQGEDQMTGAPLYQPPYAPQLLVAQPTPVSSRLPFSKLRLPARAVSKRPAYQKPRLQLMPNLYLPTSRLPTLITLIYLLV